MVIAAVAVIIRLILIATPFAYIPDVFYYDTQAVQALQSGSNPYGHHYVAPIGLTTPGAENVFAYLPGVVEFLLPFFAAGGDIRLGLVACDMLVAFALCLMRSKRAGPMAAVYLLLPTSVLFSTWYPNDTLIGMAPLGLALATRERERYAVSAAFVGLALASSQLVWLLYPFILVGDLKAQRLKEVAISLMTFLIVVAPFVVWNPTSFFGNTVYFELGRPVQGLLTPEPFGVNVNPTLSGLVMSLFGLSVPLVLKVGIAMAALVLLLRKADTPEKALLRGSLFLVLMVIVIPSNFSWWYLELPLMTLMTWFIASGGSETAHAKNP